MTQRTIEDGILKNIMAYDLMRFEMDFVFYTL